MIAAARSLASFVLFASAVTAPYQCASRPGPERRIEEEPAEALYDLADRFKAEGNEKARAETLRYLLEKFPASRFAEAAKQDLAAMPAK